MMYKINEIYVLYFTLTYQRHTMAFFKNNKYLIFIQIDSYKYSYNNIQIFK